MFQKLIIDKNIRFVTTSTLSVLNILKCYFISIVLKNTLLTILRVNTQQPQFIIFQGGNAGIASSSASVLNGQWQFLAITFDGTKQIIYLNGIQVGANSLIYILPTINRTKNYIGKSNWPDMNSWSYFDDLKFYNIALTQAQINDAMISNETNCMQLISTSTTVTTILYSSRFKENIFFKILKDHVRFQEDIGLNRIPSFYCFFQFP